MLDYRMATFLTLYKEMNYRRTAEVLRMTQPGVTQHIQYLERHYGVKLFEYDGRKLRRTRHAESLKRCLDSMLAREKTLRTSFAQAEAIHLDVGATKTIGEFVLAPVLSQYLADANHSVRFEINNTETLLEMLENSLLDFAVVEGVFDKQKYGWHLYRKERFVGICAAHHPFAGKSVPLEEVMKQTLIVREPGSGTRHLLEQAIADHGYSLTCFPRLLCISQFSLITALTSQSSAVTFGYQPVASGRTDLATFEIEDLPLSGEFNFVYCDEETARNQISLFFGGKECP